MSGWLVLGGVAVTTVSVLVSELRYVTEVAVAWLWVGILLFLMLQSWFGTFLRPRFVLGILVSWSVLLVIPGWWSFFDLWQRASGFLYNSNGFAGAMLWPLCMSAVLAAAGWHRRWTIPALFVTVSTFLISLSLTAIAAIIVPVAVVALWYRKIIRWRYIALFSIITAVAATIIWGIWRPPEIIHFMSTEHFRTSFSQRQEFNRVVYRMWQAKPLTGWGLGSFKQTFPRFTTQFNEQPLYAHNVFAQVFAETGVVGGFGWLAIVIIIGRAGLKSIRTSTEGLERLVMRGLFLGWIAFTVHALVDFSWHFPAGQVWWLLSSAVFIARRRPEWLADSSTRMVRTVSGILGMTTIGVATIVLLAITPTNRGQRAVNANNDELAITQYSQAYRFTSNPDTASAIAGVYWLRRADGDLEAAERILRSALRSNGDDYFLHSALGHNLVAQRRLPEAVDAFATATRLDPYFHPEFFYNYVIALKNDGRRDEAAAVLRRALERYGGVTTLNPIIQRQLPLLQQLQADLLPETG